VHASTRILLLLVAIVAMIGGWWLLVVNNTFIAAVIYGSLWAAAVLFVTFVLLKIGFGYNRFTTRRRQGPPEKPATAAAALAEVTRLRDAGLISDEEYAAKRAGILDRL
jgi:membrane protein implicated in regulation of membrane protease activity